MIKLNRNQAKALELLLKIYDKNESCDIQRIIEIHTRVNGYKGWMSDKSGLNDLKLSELLSVIYEGYEEITEFTVDDLRYSSEVTVNNLKFTLRYDKGRDFAVLMWVDGLSNINCNFYQVDEVVNAINNGYWIIKEDD